MRLRPVPPSAVDYTSTIAAKCSVAVDIGCGVHSALEAFRPGLRTIGVDVSEEYIELAKQAGSHDAYIVADVLQEDISTRVEQIGFGRPDLVTMYGVIEHLPKRLGLEMLERCETLTSAYVLLETPNGFVEQGPEGGNEYQRHLSGWFPHDFEGLGYTVSGSTGFRAVRGYAAGPRWNVRGIGLADSLLSAGFSIRRRPRFAFNLVAVKDVRGVHARL
jgi:hypothetical protein